MFINYLYIIYLLKIVPTFTYTLTDCDLIPTCMNEYNISTVKDLSNITCKKSTSCGVTDLSFSSKFQNSLNIALENLDIIKQDTVSSLVQLTFTASLPPQLQSEGSFLFQIDLGGNLTCYNFYIPFSSLSYNNRRFVLPCIRLTSQLYQLIAVLAYFKELKESKYEIMNIQGAAYVFKDTSTVQVLQSSFRNIIAVVGKRYIYITSNIEIEPACPYFYNISIIKSIGDPTKSDFCNPAIQKTVCQWTSNLTSSHLCLNCSRKKINPSQTYCIYSQFFAHEKCKYIYPAKTVQITFFKIPPQKFVSQTFCRGWNASITYDIISKDRKIHVKFFPQNEYENCFVSYEFRLYATQSSDCRIISSQTPLHIINVPHEQGVVTNKTFTNIPNGNYCFEITPCDMECSSVICRSLWTLVNKKTISIEDSTEEGVHQQNNPLHVVIAGILLLLITVPAIICCIIKKCRRTKDFDELKMKKSSSHLMPPIRYIFHCEDVVADVSRFAEEMEQSLRPTHPDIEVHTFKKKVPEILIKSDVWFMNNIKWECDGRGPICTSNMKLIVAVSKKFQLIDQLDNNPSQMSPEDILFHEFLNYMKTNKDRFRNDHFHEIKVCFDAKFDSEPETRGTCLRALRDIASFCSDGIAKLLHCKRICRSVNGACYNLNSENRKNDFYLALRKGLEDTS